MKYLSLIMIGYSVFILILDFGPFEIWTKETVELFKNLDVAFAIFSLITTFFFWFYRNDNFLIKNAGIKFFLFFTLIWAGIITGIELSSLGFSTLIVVVLISVFFIYNRLISAVISLSGAVLALIGTVYIRNGLDDSLMPTFIILIPIIVISVLISHKNYLNKVNELERTAKLNELNVELNAIKENLENQVERRTIELYLAKEKAEESDRLKSAFLANMSHEIRTPMNGILGFAELLKEPGLSGEDQANYISMIEEGGERMLNIINNLIDISKLESGMTKISVAETNINKQMEYIHSFFLPEVEQKGMKLFVKTSLKDEDAVILTDREKIYAILTNLVKNAIKYSESGYIEIGCNLKTIESKTIPTTGQSERIEIEELEFYVKDTGIGIAQNRQIAVFERFIQADSSDKRAFQGAGLGLSISKGYAELLGGKMWMESESGKGSVFYFTIPYTKKV
jgi:signal transduction histidine kinase